MAEPNVQTFLSGFLHYATESTHGTEIADGSVTTAAGWATGGELAVNANPVEIEGIGNQYLVRGGRIEAAGTANLNVQSKTLMAYAVRASQPAGALTSLTVWGGTIAGHGAKLWGAKINTLEVECADGGLLTATLGLMALNGREQWGVASGSEAVLAGNVFAWQEGDVKVEGQNQGMKVRRARISVNNNCFYVSDLDAGTAGTIRQGSEVKEGGEIVEATLEVRVPAILFAASALGTTTTIVASQLTQVDDFWNDSDVIAISGTAGNIGLRRTVSDFVAATDTVTVGTAFAAATASGDKFWLVPQMGMDELKPKLDATVTFTDTGDATHTITFTLSDMHLVRRPQPLGAGADEVVYTYELRQSKRGTLAIT